jgi:hypothetical protein
MVNNSSNTYDEQIEVLSPVAPAKTTRAKLTPRSNIITGKRIGLFWNRKPNGDILLARFGELLKERITGVTIEWLEGKGNSSQAAPASAVKEALQKCDAVILAPGD